MIHPILWQYAAAILHNLRASTKDGDSSAKDFHTAIGNCLRECWEDPSAANEKLTDIIGPFLSQPINLSLHESNQDQSTKSTPAKTTGENHRGSPGTCSTTAASSPSSKTAASTPSSKSSSNSPPSGDRNVTVDISGIPALSGFGGLSLGAGDESMSSSANGNDDDHVPDELFDSDFEGDDLPVPALVDREDDSSGEELPAEGEAPQEKVKPIKQKRRSCKIGRKWKGDKHGESKYERKTERTYKFRPAKKMAAAESPVNTESKLQKMEVRLMISYYYVHVENMPPPPKWMGHGGTIGRVVKGLNLNLKRDYNKVQKVIETTYQHMKDGKAYLGEGNHDGGHPTMIKEGSKEEQHIADCKEKSMSFTQTKDFINDWRRRNGITEAVTRSAVVAHYMRMSRMYQTWGSGHRVVLTKQPRGLSPERAGWLSYWRSFERIQT